MSMPDVYAHPAKEVYLTGGEPVLTNLKAMRSLMSGLKDRGKEVYMYSAECSEPGLWTIYLRYLAGASITIHSKEDWPAFREWYDFLSRYNYLKGKSIRLNLFDLDGESLEFWQKTYKDCHVRAMEWITDCPIPSGEDFGECLI